MASSTKLCGNIGVWTITAGNTFQEIVCDDIQLAIDLTVVEGPLSGGLGHEIISQIETLVSLTTQIEPPTPTSWQRVTLASCRAG
jgi:hypothetical protein